MVDAEPTVVFSDKTEQVESSSKTLLREGVKKSWLFAFLVSSFLTIASFVFINSTQAYILTDILDTPRAKLGVIQGNLSSMDEGVSMVMVIIWGVLSDRIGRRAVFSGGFLLMALATFLYPLASSVYGESSPSLISFFNSLLFYRLIFACGGAATSDMLTVVLGDYAAEGKRSKLAGLLGVSTGFGACFGALFLNRLPTFFTRKSPSATEFISSEQTIYASFWITACLLVGGAFISGFGVRQPPQNQSDPLLEVEESTGNKLDRTCPIAGASDSPLNSSTKCWWKRMVFGFKAIKTRPTLLAAYLGGFVARGDSIILSVFLPPWIASYFAKNNLCNVDPSSISDAAMYITKCPEAKRLVSTLTGISNLSALLAAPLVGNFSDRLGPTRALAIPAALGACAYGGMLLIGDPRSRIVMFMAVLQGFAQIGMIISSVSLVAKEAPPHARGAISGVYSLFGAFGIITVSKLGGALTEIWTETGPFSVIAVANIVLLIVLVYLRK